jgi:hypothetical protein
MVQRISKVLSPNDLGANGSHQDGLLIPKRPDFIAFFPALDEKTFNPSIMINFVDADGVMYVLRFIHYNNKRVAASNGKLGTRDEYRLTRIAKFLKKNQLQPGDKLEFEKSEEKNYHIKCTMVPVQPDQISRDLWEIEFV